MLISLTFGGALVEFLPDGASGNTMPYTCLNGASVADVLQEVGIPTDKAVLAILNGDLVQPDTYSHSRLSDGDALSLVPPIQAG